jgi:hypothetical protein
MEFTASTRLKYLCICDHLLFAAQVLWCTKGKETKREKATCDGCQPSASSLRYLLYSSYFLVFLLREITIRSAQSSLFSAFCSSPERNTLCPWPLCSWGVQRHMQLCRSMHLCDNWIWHYGVWRLKQSSGGNGKIIAVWYLKLLCSMLIIHLVHC